MGSTTGEEEEWDVMGQGGRKCASALSSLLVTYDACITSESSSSADNRRVKFLQGRLQFLQGREYRIVAVFANKICVTGGTIGTIGT